MLKRRGGFLVGALAAGGISVLAFFLALQSIAPMGKAQGQAQERLVAELYATELLEYFVSLSSDQLQVVLSTDAVLKTKPLCTYLNIANTTNTAVLNAWAAASLPSLNPLDNFGVPSNRYFKIEVVDIKTLVLRPDVCTKLPSQIQLPGRTAVAGAVILNACESFKISVGVIWRSLSGEASSPLKRVELSSTSLNL